MRGCERHATMFMFRGLQQSWKHLGTIAMSLAADRGAWLGRERGAAGCSVEGGQSNQNPNPKLKAVDWQTRGTRGASLSLSITVRCSVYVHGFSPDASSLSHGPPYGSTHTGLRCRIGIHLQVLSPRAYSYFTVLYEGGGALKTGPFRSVTREPSESFPRIQKVATNLPRIL
jgi:hypothetical protein